MSGRPLRIIDVSDPIAPREVGTTFGGNDFEVIGGDIYLAAWDQGLRVIDILDPGDGLQQGFFVSYDSAQRLTVTDEYILLATTRTEDGPGGLYILKYERTDNAPPYGMVTFNAPSTGTAGAIYTTYEKVKVSLPATDSQNAVSKFRIAYNHQGMSKWLDYQASLSTILTGTAGENLVQVQFADAVGNISAVVSDTILVDTSKGHEFGLSVNDGALWTNRTAVSLTIPAEGGTAEMQVSNDGGFQGIAWEPYTLYKPWTLVTQRTDPLPRIVYVRFRDTEGVISAIYQDDIILDTRPPRSAITQLEMIATGAASRTAPIIRASWSGEDDLSGIQWYDVDVRVGSGAWVPWKTHTLDLAGDYPASPGQQYTFRTRACDKAGNWETGSDTGDKSIATPGPTQAMKLYLPALKH
jgi:hypothetical protein